jgi:carbonic anhydrase/acetyltransferase-like protein (isoleucine patch superfamily)
MLKIIATLCKRIQNFLVPGKVSFPPGALVSARGFYPQVDSTCFVADNSRIVGDVVVGKKSSMWYNVTLRGDVMPIRIGEESNIQDGSVLHGTYKKAACEIGNRVTIGHLVMLHGCKIGDKCLVGMGSNVIRSLPENSKVVGNPAKLPGQ